MFEYYFSSKDPGFRMYTAEQAKLGISGQWLHVI